MNKRIVFRHMDHSPAIEELANKHLQKIEHFLENEPTPIYIDLVMEPSKTREHSRIELRVKSPHYDKIIHHEFQGDKFYDVLNDVIEKMHKELLEEKKKVKKDDWRHRGVPEDFKKF
ncbi:HPF/RaiA family ribosome-associated protein [bacterium]|nr:MAG: HPF/RaiA family ribosome-associated protein [bacterium]QQR61773.1 MAG: HPF/RaiA family ribosome-associated protein [bacterium]